MAGSLNKVMLIGRLGRDPELKYTQSGQPVVSLNMATDESYTKDGQKVEQTEWHRLTAWGKTAEIMGKYLAKGSLIFVEGKLQTRQWQDKEGNTRYTTEIMVRQFQFLETKGQGQGQSQNAAPAPGYGGNQNPQQPQQPQQNQNGYQAPGPQYDDAPF
jgi:single-strand DNA-binding protein